MTGRAIGALALAIVLPGAGVTIRDYRAGVSRCWLSGGVVPFRFRRDGAPLLFWGSTIVNALLIAAIGAAGIALLAGAGG